MPIKGKRTHFSVEKHQKIITKSWRNKELTSANYGIPAKGINENTQIPMRFTKKTGRRLYHKETKADRFGKKTGRWSRTEHLRFVQSLKLYGFDDC